MMRAFWRAFRYWEPRRLAFACFHALSVAGTIWGEGATGALTAGDVGGAFLLGQAFYCLAYVADLRLQDRVESIAALGRWRFTAWVLLTGVWVVVASIMTAAGILGAGG